MKFFDHTIYTLTKIDRHEKTSVFSVPSVVNEQTTSGFDISLTNSAFTQFRTSNYTYIADKRNDEGVKTSNGNGLEEALYKGFAFELIDTAGVVKAHYEYSPFGKVVHKSGTMSGENPFQFSTKYLDNETQLYYYGLRYYNPENGRWINRDPIVEKGSYNLYQSCVNNHINVRDYLGMYPTSETEFFAGVARLFQGVSDSVSNSVSSAVSSIVDPIISKIKSWNDKAKLRFSYKEDIRWKSREFDVGIVEVKFAGGLTFNVSADCKCVKVKATGFAQAEGAGPPLFYGIKPVVRVKGELAASYKYCWEDNSHGWDDSYFGIILAGGLKWGYSVDVMSFEGDLGVEVGISGSWKWRLPDFTYLKSSFSVYGRAYYEWKPGYWSAWRRRQIKFSYGG